MSAKTHIYHYFKNSDARFLASRKIHSHTRFLASNINTPFPSIHKKLKFKKPPKNLQWLSPHLEGSGGPWRPLAPEVLEAPLRPQNLISTAVRGFMEGVPYGLARSIFEALRKCLEGPGALKGPPEPPKIDLAGPWRQLQQQVPQSPKTQNPKPKIQHPKPKILNPNRPNGMHGPIKLEIYIGREGLGFRV